MVKTYEPEKYICTSKQNPLKHEKPAITWQTKTQILGQWWIQDSPEGAVC